MTLTSRVAMHVPDRVLARVICSVYRRAEPELGHLDEICGRGGIMIDVGAWYGPWSQRLARRADRLVALEPTARYHVLRQTLPANAHVVHAAASDHQGSGQLWTAGSGDGAEGLGSIVRREIHSTATEVQLIRIDDLGLSGVTFIKIDVEGHELAVLRGAADTIRADRPRLLLEVETRMQRIDDLLGTLASWGYSGWALRHGTWFPLGEFDLAQHQAKTLRTAERGLFRRLLWPYPRYVNSVLFTPDEAAKPGLGRSGGVTPM
jgi:FkbM family methyltransferase